MNIVGNDLLQVLWLGDEHASPLLKSLDIRLDRFAVSGHLWDSGNNLSQLNDTSLPLVVEEKLEASKGFSGLCLVGVAPAGASLQWALLGPDPVFC